MNGRMVDRKKGCERKEGSGWMLDWLDYWVMDMDDGWIDR